MIRLATATNCRLFTSPERPARANGENFVEDRRVLAVRKMLEIRLFKMTRGRVISTASAVNGRQHDGKM